MIAAELRGRSKPSLNEALGWIGSRVDDIYGANVGRLEDVWIDPGNGVPRWLLVKEGRFGGRSTLIPFEDATAGAGHVWVPYEHEVVRDAPEIEPGAPLTQHVEAALRTHYASKVPAAISHVAQRQAGPTHEASAGRQPGSTMGTARFNSPPEAGPPEHFHDSEEHHATDPPRRSILRPDVPEQEQPQAPRPEQYRPQQAGEPQFAPRLPDRPAPPITVPQPEQRPQAQEPPQTWSPAPAQQHRPASPQQPYGEAGYAPPQPPAYAQPQPTWQAPPLQAEPPPQGQPVDAAQGAVDQLRALADAGATHYVEIELSGELTIRGELRSIKVIPRGGDSPQRH